jgi:pectate lyase C
MDDRHLRVARSGLVALVALAAACGADDAEPGKLTPGSGGQSAAVGGSAPTGGAATVSSGGSSVASGGRSSATGGSVSSGGLVSTGGTVNASGGSRATGGAGLGNSGAGGAAGKASTTGGSAGKMSTGGAASTGGSSTSGGKAGTGGTTATGGSSTGGSGGGSTGTPAKSCPNPGNGGVVNETIVVAANQTYDGGCKRFTAGSGLGDGSQSEDQKPVFRVEDGARLINVVLGGPAADGIHTYGDVTLENITWEDIGEDALTIKESGTVVLNGGSAKNGDDKVFQVNAASTFRISNFTASNAGKFIRQNGDTTFKVEIFIDRCDISNMDESIFRTDSSSSTVSMTNTRYSNIGDDLFMGVAAGNITQMNNTQY